MDITAEISPSEIDQYLLSCRGDWDWVGFICNPEKSVLTRALHHSRGVFSAQIEGKKTRLLRKGQSGAIVDTPIWLQLFEDYLDFAAETSLAVTRRKARQALYRALAREQQLIGCTCR